jgi:DNA-binding NarL/FixJ family response regulator
MSDSVNGRIRILLVDDHATIRAGLRMLISTQPAMTVIEDEAGRSDEALSIAAREQPDIILLDLDLGPKSPQGGLDLIPPLISSCPSARILVLTGVTDS